VQLGPGEVRDIPISIKQNVTEAVGSTHQVRIIAASKVTFTNPNNPVDAHDEARSLSGVTFQVSVLSKTTLNCSLQNGVVTGEISGLDPRDAQNGTQVAVVPAVQTQAMNEVLRGDHVVLGPVMAGKFKIGWPYGRGVCLYAGGIYSSSSGSAAF
jgi:hypothetical protein